MPVNAPSVPVVAATSMVKMVVLVLLFAVLSACSAGPQKPLHGTRTPEELAKIPDPTPKVEPRSKLGNMKTYEVFGIRYYVQDSSDGFTEKGIASWYGPKFHGKKTSSGEIYDMYAMTAAHRTLPLPTYLEVKNLENGRKITVRVNDRGPFHDNRIVDLSYTAAIKLDMLEKGTALVAIRALDPRTHRGAGAPVETRLKTAARLDPPEFYIQVGVFFNYSNAETRKNQLMTLQAPVKIDKITLNNRVAFRVKIGPLTDIARADDIVSRLELFDIRGHSVFME